MQIESIRKSIETEGFHLKKELLDKSLTLKLKNEIEIAIIEKAIYHKNIKHKDYGMILDCAHYGGELLRIFDNHELFIPMEEILGEDLIIYSNTSSSMPPNLGNYSSRIHGDSKEDIIFRSNKVMALLLLDDFNIQNGVTWILPKSHLLKNKPPAPALLNACDNYNPVEPY